MFGSLPKTRSRLLAGIVLVVGLVMYAVPLANAAPAAPTALPLIDHFDSLQGPLDAVLNTGAGSSLADANVLGGERDIVVTVNGGSLPSPAGMHVSVGNSLFSSSQDSGVFGQALITYDGLDGNPGTLDPTGLGGVDLTQGNTTNGLSLTSRLNDLPINIVVTIYTNGTSASSATITLQGGQPSSAPPVTHYLEFAAFSQAAGATSPANFSSVGAITVLIDGFNDASDLTIEELTLESLDWGDLPDNSVGGPNYPTTYAADGPRHVIGSLYLGSLIDPFEMDGVPSVGATGDDTTGMSDEDGVTRTAGVLWHSGADGGSVDVTVTGGSGCLSGWIDWNNDGDFADAGENVLSNVPLSTGTSTQTFFIPTDPGNGTFYARFRLFAPDAGGACTSAKAPTGRAVNGEVEDYRWGFGPNAVNVTSFSGSAVPVAALPVVSVVVASTLALLAGAWRIFRG